MSNTYSDNLNIRNVYVAGKPAGSQWNICFSEGSFTSISPCEEGGSARSGLVIPSFCHPHVHLDKCFLLSHPKYADLRIKKGDFAEALEVTNQAKARFEHKDLMERGSALIEESIKFGVTHMRAFVEVDSTVRMKCLDAGLALKENFQTRCYIQVCVFAQDPIFSYDDGGQVARGLLEEAVQRPGVEAFGSTPYVEEGGDPNKQILNIKYAIDIARRYKLHLDLHIDYNLDPGKKSFVLEALDILHGSAWPTDRVSTNFRTVAFGHCTRLTLFNEKQWQEVADKVDGLPVSFIGLPTSDLYMMGKPPLSTGGGERVRGTLQIPQMIKKYKLNAAIGINNIGNAFTPQGSCDPLNLASLCVGIYQAGTIEDVNILLECVSSRAKAAIGLGRYPSHDLLTAIPSDFVMFGNRSSVQEWSFRNQKSVQDLIYEGKGGPRTTYYKGRAVT